MVPSAMWTDLLMQGCTNAYELYVQQDDAVKYDVFQKNQLTD